MCTFRFVFVLLYVISVYGQITRLGRCTPVQTVADVNWNKMEGRWYRMSEFPERDPRLQNQTCLSEIKEVNNDGTISVYASWLNTFTSQFFQDMFVGRIIPDAGNPGMATFDGTLDSVPQYQYYIMAVQYDNFHLLYGCEDGKGRQDSLETAFIFSRTPEPLEKSQLDSISCLLRNNGVDPDNFLFVDHSSCPKLQ
ncbi:apolipoprotein D-like [Mytilus trossulus]|uniref:apolipoprotein D-like n=1 Tax=Mytilus trossulus TaxID=6551 RepID=UPI0030041C2E